MQWRLTSARDRMPGVKPPDNIRLPGPHYVLENVLVEEVGNEDAERRRTASVADRWFRDRPLAERKSSDADNTKRLSYDVSRPEIPFFLAQARGCSTIPQPETTAEESYKVIASPPIEPGSFLPQGTNHGMMPHTPLPPQQGFAAMAIDPNMDPHLVRGIHSQHQLPGDLQQGTFLTPYTNQYPDTGPPPRFPFSGRSYSYGNP